MPLTKDQITEIQASAKYNTEKRIRDAREEVQYKEELAEKIQESKKPKLVSKSVK
jgi:hypothetical protein